MDKLEINVGDIFNHLTIVRESEPKTVNGKKPRRQFVCECICGKMVKTRLDGLRSNKKSSCGCRDTIKIKKTGNSVEKHGFSRDPLYKIWKGIRKRCYSVIDVNYYRYGGRGIKMSNEWYVNPVSFIEWCLNNGYDKGLELDRINNDEGYSPSNCRWTTSEVNNNNKRNNIKYLYAGEMLTLPQISKRCSLGFPTLYRRINVNNLTLEEALSIPINGKCKKEPYASRKLSYDEVISIFLSKEKTKKLTEKYNIHKSTIQGIRAGTRYSDYSQNIIK